MAQLVFRDPNIRIRQPKSLIVFLPKEMRPYQFKKTRTPRLEPTYDRPTPPPEEVLLGNIRGVRASALEERLARALDFFGMSYIFQYEVDSAYSLPSEGKTIDFIVFDGGIGVPLEPGAGFVHDSPSDKEKQKERQNIINPILQLRGILPLGLPEYQLPFDRPYSLEDAKDLIAAMFISI